MFRKRAGVKNVRGHPIGQLVKVMRSRAETDSASRGHYILGLIREMKAVN